MKSSDTFVRQSDNPGAALNTDKRGLEAYKKRKERENEINNIKQEVADIKNLLQQILNKVG
jgi:hypothetical protein